MQGKPPLHYYFAKLGPRAGCKRLEFVIFFWHFRHFRHFRHREIGKKKFKCRDVDDTPPDLYFHKHTLWKSSKGTAATAPLILEAMDLHASPTKSGTENKDSESRLNVEESLSGTSNCLKLTNKWPNPNSKNDGEVFVIRIEFRGCDRKLCQHWHSTLISFCQSISWPVNFIAEIKGIKIFIITAEHQ